MFQAGGRLLLLATCHDADPKSLSSKLAGWCRDAGLRLSPPRSIPADDPRWLLAVATRTEPSTAAA